MSVSKLTSNFLSSLFSKSKTVAQKLNELIDFSRKPTIIDANSSTLVLTPEDSGKTIMLNRAAGVTVTLPEEEVGARFKFVVATTVTSNAYIINGKAITDLFIGAVTSVDDVTPEVATMFKPDVTDDDSISMNGTTTGGKIGTVIIVTCIAANRWLVEGTLAASGTLATPFL
jgi:hypothetical protein